MTDKGSAANQTPGKASLALNIKNVNIFSKNNHVSIWMLIACGVWLLGLGFYFIAFRPPLLPEDLRFMGTTLAQINSDVPGLERWLERVLTVLGGFMAGAGVLTVFVAIVVMPLRLKGTAWVIAFSGVFTVGLMSAANFAIHSDFRWLLLVPALIWFAGFVFYVAGHARSNRDDHFKEDN